MNKFKIGAIFVGVVIALVILILPLFIERIPNGYVGVVYSPNGGVQDDVLGQGWHLIGIFDRVTKYPVRMQTVHYNDMQVATSDGKNITIDFAYNYQIQPEMVVPIFNKFGQIAVEDIENSYLRTRFWDAARQGISKFTVIDTYGEKSTDAKVKVQEIFSKDVGELGFVIQDVTVGVPQPDEKTQEAIDLRVKASQELERKNTEVQIAEKEAERKRVEAEGIAQARIAEAEGIAKANRLIQESLTDRVLQHQLIEQLPNIELPKVMGGDGNIISLPESLMENAKEN